MDLHIGVLGPVEVGRDGQVVPVPGAKERALLATLAVRTGWLLTAEQIIEVLWGDNPPPTARRTLRSYVSRLRRLVGDAIVAGGDGYALDLPAECVDAKLFEQLVHDGTTGGRPAALADALRLWRGQPFTDLPDSGRGKAEARRLMELRMAAVIGDVEWRLQQGETTTVLGTLERELAEHPYREMLWAQLVRALNDSGRRADALRAYQRARNLLVDELGLEPGPELRAAEALVLQETRPVAPGPDGKPRPSFHLALRQHPLVARRSELEALVDVWHLACRGATGWATVLGGPGMGKTRLLAELAAEVVDDGDGVVLYGYGDPTLPLPFGPLVMATQSLVSPSMAAASSELSALYGDGDAARLGRLGDGQRLRLYNQVGRLIADAATTSPVCLILDDLHWVDEATIATLRHLLRLPRSRVAVIVASRPPPRASPAAALLDELAGTDGHRRLELGPIDREAAVGLARPHLSDRAAIDRVVDRAGGCPLLVVELARSSEMADTDRHPSDLSAGTEAAVQRRLSALPAEAVDLLQAAAVFGRQFELEALSRVLGQPVDRLAGALDPAVAGGLLDETADRLGHYSFSHDVVADALLAGLGRNATAALHRRAGRALAELASGPTDPRWMRAAHHLQVGGGRHPSVFAAAGRLAARLADPAAAVHWFSAGLDDESVTGRTRVELLLGLGEAKDRTLQAGARTTYLEAIELASNIDDDLLVEAVIGLTRYNQARNVATADRAVLDAIELAWARHDPSDHQVVARLAAAECAELLWTGSSKRRRELRDRAVDAALQAGDPSLLGEIAGLTYLATGWPGDVERRRATAQQALGAMAASDDGEGAILARVAAGYAAFEGGDVPEADRLAAEADGLVNRGHHTALSWRVTALRAALAMFHDELDLAEELISAVASESRRVGSPQDMLVARALGQLAVERDDLEPLCPVLDAMMAGPTVEGWRSARTYVLAALGRTEEAGAELAALVDRLPAVPWTVGWLTHRCAEALAAAIIGDGPRARTLVETLMPFRDHLCIDMIASMGPVAHAAGRASVAADDIDGGRNLLEQAVVMCRSANAPRWRARAESALVQLP